EFQQAMIDKDAKMLNSIMDEDYTLIHMSGKIQTKQEYIEDIVNGILNYYHSTIIEPSIVILEEKYAKLNADVELDAKVYGIKGTWTLHTEILMEKIENKWILSKWEN
ncbi:MAG: nuclear transport factor 2 family protein, partial [Methanosphaera stadtmanae]|nr:nuclear transport factor 2 family protein [Methanosphaera stadtmanae]